MLDSYIHNIKIIDGSGSLSYIGNVGIEKGKIKFVTPISESDSNTPESKLLIDGTNLTLCPGFIDSHSHSDLCLGANPETAYMGKISQGITSEVTGQCGFSLFPVTSAHLVEAGDVLDAFIGSKAKKYLSSFTSFQEFKTYADSVPKIMNYAFLVGHSTLRTAVMGTVNRKPTSTELDEMKALLKEAMVHGAKGLSSGLVYIPGTYCEKEELIELCKVIAPYQGIYATHMRNEAEGVTASVAEAISVAESAGVSLVISHHKICGKQNWGLSKETLELIRSAEKRGVTVHFDMYPYHATQTTLDNCIPPQYFSEGIDALSERLKSDAFREHLKAEISAIPAAYDNPYQNAGGFGGILISNCSKTSSCVRKTLLELSEDSQRDGFDVLFDLLIENHFEVSATYFSLNEDEMISIYLDDHAMIGSDAICRETPGPVHPRAYGSFVKPLADFSLKRNLLSLETAVHKQTGLTANTWHLPGKGLISEGFDADLVIFDEAKLKDQATFEHGSLLSKGICFVYVAGERVLKNNEFTGAKPGKCL